MDFREECDAAVEALRSVDSLRGRVAELEDEVRQMRANHDKEINTLWVRIDAISGAPR